MEKVFMYVLMIVGVLGLVSTSVDITVSSGTCNNYYTLDNINEAYLTYNGAALEKEECYVKFLLDTTYLQRQCVQAVYSQGIACSTKIEVHDVFISKYVQPEKKYTCTDVSYEEWCGSDGTSTVYIVFRTNGRSSYTHFKIRVSLKKLPGEKDSDRSSNLIAAIVVPIILVTSILVAVTVALVVCKMRQQSGRPQYLGRNNISALQVPMPPLYQQQQQMQPPPPPPPPPGNYQMHSMHRAYSAHSGHAVTSLMYNQQPPIGQAAATHGCNPHQPVRQSGDPLAYNPQQTGGPTVYSQQQPSASFYGNMDPPSYDSVVQ